MIPLETRFLHSPESTHGYVNAALSSNIFHFFEEKGEYRAEKVIDSEAREHGDWDMPVSPFIAIHQRIHLLPIDYTRYSQTHSMEIRHRGAGRNDSYSLNTSLYSASKFDQLMSISTEPTRSTRIELHTDGIE
jgi:56kDa selenium binding protein (SBP56)